ncbi:MAG: exonuclease SbcC, partial [Flavobacteriales bacterium]
VRAEESVKAAKEAFDDFEPRYTDAVSALDAALTACGREFEAHERQPKIITQWLEEQVEAAEKESLSALERANEVKTADERHEAARVAASQAQTADEERSKRRQLLDGQIDVAKAEAASAELQLGRERDGAQKLEDQFAAQLDTAAIPSPRREGRLDSVSALRTLRERVAEFDRRKQCAEEAKIAANAAHTALAAAQGAHEHAVRELEEATLQLEEAEKDTGRHNAKLNTLFDGQDPDDVEIQHKAAIAAAVLNHEDAQRAATESENAVIRAQTTAQGLDKQVKEHKTQAIAADVLLQTALSNIEAVETLDDIRAKLLSDEERTRVGELCTALERREEAADVELKRVAAHAASHLDKRPDGLVAGDVDLEHVQTVRAQIAAALESWNEEVGSHRQRVKQLHADARDAAELLSEAEAQRNVASTWQRLHDLIGLNKGANFQRFALALALERLLLRANHRLQTLHPRYQLAPTPDETGLPTLDFDVVDLYQAGVTRPVATLSGGESFLASLALALAVVDEQQLSLPIETLLLDEGFGTLDEQSLSQAMTTLERLQLQDSRTVGLISHVESLKTRVTNQVQILPAGQDRSTVKLRVWGTPS